MKKRILVVDDEGAILFALSEYFRTLGFDVDCAREMEEAEALLSHVKYDLVFLDLRLTGSGGTEGLEIIRFVRERNPWTPVALLTAYGSSDVEEEARRRGADLVLQKPKPLPEVAQVVLGLLGGSAA
jgi:CheY-like chemotaxis protein